MTKPRPPYLYWAMQDLRENGFVEMFKKHCDCESVVGLRIPEKWLIAWAELVQGKITADEFRKVATETGGPMMTIRTLDEERTLHGAFNESRPCPPDCC